VSDRWSITETDQGWQVERNGSWYSDVEDEQEGLGLLRNRRVPTVTITEKDGYKRTIRVR
jgi:hypothetical protein